MVLSYKNSLIFYKKTRFIFIVFAGLSSVMVVSNKIIWMKLKNGVDINKGRIVIECELKGIASLLDNQ